MNFVKVDKVPQPKRPRYGLQKRIEEFMRMNTPSVLIELKPGEYSNVWVAYTTLTKACKISGYPVGTVKRGDNLYLVRKDME